MRRVILLWLLCTKRRNNNPLEGGNLAGARSNTPFPQQFPTAHPFWEMGSPGDCTASLGDQGTPGCCNHGKLPSCVTPGLPPASPSHQNISGRMIGCGNCFPQLPPPLPGTCPRGPPLNIYILPYIHMLLLARSK